MGKYCVYKHTSPNGKVYIGVTSRKPERRWNSGLGYKENEYFSRSIAKYGWNSFKHEILFSELSREDASRIEKELIAEYDSTNRSKGYNIELGGLSTSKCLSEETKRKIGDSHRGRYTEAQIEATKHRKNPHYHHSDEIKALIGDVHRGKPLSEEHKKKLSEAHKGIKPSEKNLRILAQMRMRRIEMYDMDMNFIRDFPSLKDAEAECGVKYQCISACCRGKAEFAGGYKWRYAT